MGQGPQSSRIIVLGEPATEGASHAPSDSVVRTTDPGPMAPSSPHAGDTDPGLQATTTVPMFLGVPSPAGEPEVEADALLDALAPRNLPEVTATSGEVAAVYATDDAAPAPRHQTPVPEPAVIVPDPRREPTHRIPREWVEPLNAIAKQAMAARDGEEEVPPPPMSSGRWAVVGLMGGVIAVVAVGVGLRGSGVSAQASAQASASAQTSAQASASAQTSAQASASAQTSAQASASASAQTSAPEASARAARVSDVAVGGKPRTTAAEDPRPAVATSAKAHTKPVASAVAEDLDYKLLK